MSNAYQRSGSRVLLFGWHFLLVRLSHLVRVCVCVCVCVWLFAVFFDNFK